jgi:hypothetical protein
MCTEAHSIVPPIPLPLCWNIPKPREMTEKIGSAGVEVGAAAGAGAGWDRGEDETRLDIGHTRMLNLASRETNCVTLVWQGDGRENRDLYKIRESDVIDTVCREARRGAWGMMFQGGYRRSSTPPGTESLRIVTGSSRQFLHNNGAAKGWKTDRWVRRGEGRREERRERRGGNRWLHVYNFRIGTIEPSVI